MRKQFDGCSYKELTDCVKARIEWIRECRDFLKDEHCYKYGYLRASTALKILIMENEIRKLLKMRRVLKKSKYKNWNSELLSV
jgi:hypothetical protein